MKHQGEKVKIKVQYIIHHDGQEEQNVAEEVGSLFKKDHFHVLRYQETNDVGETIRNLITIQPEQVNIRRSGAISMNQRFIEKQTTEGIYKHEYGEFYMETNTHSIDYKPLTRTEQGTLKMNYTVLMNGNIMRKHELKVVYRQEA